MVLQPRNTDQIYESIKTRILDSIVKVTNFVDGSFDDVWLRSHSQQVREVEIKALAVQLSGYVDYAGKELTQNDLDRLGIEGVDPEEINPYMKDQHLDELGKTVGADRYEGAKATGQVTFTVSSDSVEIQEGYRVGTKPGPNGQNKSFYVDADGDGEIDETSTATVSPATGDNTVTADIIAAEVGEAYNIGAGTITYLPSPQPGIESVTNNAQTTGGENRQPNPEFRQEIKRAPFETSGGGTELGIIGEIESGTASDVDVTIDEFYNQQPPFVEVIVDGGSEAEIKDLIEKARPVGIEHNLVRPSKVNLGIRADVVGSNVDTQDVQSSITNYLTGIGVSELFSRTTLIQQIMTSDTRIESVPALNTYISEVLEEAYTYDSTQSIYELEYSPLGRARDELHLYRPTTSVYPLEEYGFPATSVTVTAVVDDERVTLSRGSSADYTVVDDDSDGNNDAISLTGNTTPDEYTTLEVSYDHTRGSVDAVTDDQGNTYTKGTDFGVVDNDGDGLNDSLDWSIGGSAPANGDRFYVDYKPRRTFVGDLSVTDREKIGPVTAAISVKNYSRE